MKAIGGIVSTNFFLNKSTISWALKAEQRRLTFALLVPDGNLNCINPRVALKFPVRILIKTDFPEWGGPIIAISSPGAAEKDIPLRTSFPKKNLLVRDSTYKCLLFLIDTESEVAF